MPPINSTKIKRRRSVSTLTVFLLFAAFSFAQITVTSDIETVDVHSLLDYETIHNISGTNAGSSPATIAFRLSQTEELVEITATSGTGGKSKALDVKKNLAKSTMDWSAFFTGATTYRLTVPENCRFTLNYKTKNSNTLFLSRQYKNGDYDALLYSCTVNLPDGLTLSTGNGKTYQSTVVFKGDDFREKQDHFYFLIHPDDSTPQNYFSEWFEKSTASLSEFDKGVLPAELETLNAEGKRDELAAACFRFVQDKIKYIAIENGINAFVPRSANHTLTTKLGDCKDMANLLCSLLKHYEFESYLGISRTNSKKDTFDFPSLAMANHMIVGLKLNGKFIFLDATEDECIFGDPSYQILGTEVFLIGHKPGYFEAVPSSLSVVPTISSSYTFRREEGTISYTSEILITGKFNLFLDEMRSSGKLDAQNLKPYLQRIMPGDFEFKEISGTHAATKLVITADVPLSKVTTIGTKTYLDLTFLPAPNSWAKLLTNSKTTAFSSEHTLKLENLQKPATAKASGNIRILDSESSFSLDMNMNAESTKAKGEIDTFWSSFTSKPVILKL